MGHVDDIRNSVAISNSALNRLLVLLLPTRNGAILAVHFIFICDQNKE